MLVCFRGDTVCRALLNAVFLFPLCVTQSPPEPSWCYPSAKKDIGSGAKDIGSCEKRTLVPEAIRTLVPAYPKSEVCTREYEHLRGPPFPFPFPMKYL